MKYKNVFKNKKVLVTGHTGFKGSWLTLWLLKLEAKFQVYQIKFKLSQAISILLKEIKI